MTTYTLDDLCSMLTSPDPVVRDETAYAQLWERIGAGEADGRLRAVGDRQAGQLAHPEIQARTFAPLILVAVLLRDEVIGELDAATVNEWRSAFADWYPHEKDLRGYDAKLGWLHAVAHGADAVEAFGRSRHLGRTELSELLEVVSARLTAPTGYLFAHGEDDRVSSAVTAVLLREELTAQDVAQWLASIEAALKAMEPGPFPAAKSNTIRTLNSLYVACHRGVRLYGRPGQDRPAAKPPHEAAILDGLAGCLRTANRYLG
ncbi:hypothetical protein Rhe02_48750 [Rhizocola hellebori]|uniref:DUF2785 domain-containing protein n=1 Tax=Rhizocola hellebori TaxID=1392758 RepID=A0A8J3VID3_9ACTN|nr:DUF2785 domain-containing protein [Rhizocola hellebori]GIH06808.1 hypothetical protein Rhe02_48750 [Rhizocola hellebori]